MHHQRGRNICSCGRFSPFFWAGQGPCRVRRPVRSTGELACNPMSRKPLRDPKGMPLILTRGNMNAKRGQEPMSRSMQLHFISVTVFFIYRFIVLDQISQEWYSRGSAMTNHKKVISRHWTGTAFLSQKKRYTKKIDQSVKMLWHRFSLGVACSYSSARDPIVKAYDQYVCFSYLVFYQLLFVIQQWLAAVKIQSAWRGHVVRSRLRIEAKELPDPQRNSAAIVIQVKIIQVKII